MFLNFYKKNLLFDNNIIIYYLILIYLISIIYKRYCINYTFKLLNNKFKKKEEWEDELKIYSISMPKFYTSFPKKKKCILLIGGYKDIPYLWNDFEKYLIDNNYDYYAPRTNGNGRKFYQIVNWKDWVITYLEAIYLLQEQYEMIDIIGFSTGSNIAIYLSQFKYKCKINNIFLCSPFLLNKECISSKILFSKNIFSKILNKFCTLFLRFLIKSKNNYSGYRSTYNEYNSINDYCEIFNDFETVNTLFNFLDFRPTQINASKIIILYSIDDNIIGNISDQCKIISNVYNLKYINIIKIPSYINQNIIYENNKPKCGHLMFKEKPEIIKDIYNNIKEYL